MRPRKRPRLRTQSLWRTEPSSAHEDAPSFGRGLSAALGTKKTPSLSPQPETGSPYEESRGLRSVKCSALSSVSRDLSLGPNLRGMARGSKVSDIYSGVMESETPAMPAKVRPYTDTHKLLAKLEGKVAMWERVARDAKERAEEFEQAAQRVREGASAVTVGRTTYILVDETSDGSHTEG